jgi:hypothetical protein
MRSVRVFLGLPAGERRLLVVATPIVSVIRLLLWILPSAIIIRGVRSIATVGSRATTRPEVAPPLLITRAVERVSRRVPGATCLTQALAAQILLYHHGHASSLCLGVARGASGDFRAHAWLEAEGRILIGDRGVHGLTRLPDLSRTTPRVSRIRRA